MRASMRGPRSGRVRRTLVRRVLSAAFAIAALDLSVAAAADAVVWPTLTPAGDAAHAQPLRKPAEADGTLWSRAQELDATLRDGIQDLGLTLNVAEPAPSSGHTRDLDLLERAARASSPPEPSDTGAGVIGTWVVSPRIEPAGGETYLVRIVAVPPNGRELRTRVEIVRGNDVAARGLVMLRELVSPTTAAQAERQERERERVTPSATLGVMSPLRSPGRAVLAVNGALFGAYAAFSVQRASGSDDPRVLYPLLALGTGVGLGGALLVADEWDVGTGHAWYLAAGAWWGAASGIFIANGVPITPLSDRYAWGVGGGLAGITLATVGLSRGRIDEGSAALTHSGAALGLFVGGLAELASVGSTTAPTPYTGMGYGTAIGLLGAGTLATFVQTTPSRVFLVDLGAGLGALAGAAAASPFLFGNVTEGNTRAFLGATFAGTLAGGAVAFFATRERTRTPPKAPAALRLLPTAGVITTSATPNGPVPAYGIGAFGAF
jgi:hypothetical protein